MKTTVLSTADLTDIVRHVGVDALMDEVIGGLTAACRSYAARRYTIPARAGFEYRAPDLGLLEWMPALEHGGPATIKIVGYHPANPARRQLPTILSSAATFDTTTGHFIGLLDATFATALRTGAASAIASRILAAPDARVLGLVGCGAQALAQLHALSRVFDFAQVLVHDADPVTRDGFAARAATLGLADLGIRAAPLAEVVSTADVLCTATSVEIGRGPVFHDRILKPRVHVNAVGSDFPGKTEIPLSLLKRSLVCPDFRPQACTEGECQQLAATDIGPDLAELVQRADEFAHWQQRSTVFDSTGWALEDHVCVGILMAWAQRLGCGTAIQIESISDDPRNPYGFFARHGTPATIEHDPPHTHAAAD